MRALALILALLPLPAAADPLAGKRYIIEMSSSQMASGMAGYLVPPLDRVLRRSSMKPAGGPGADVVINVVAAQDAGRWVAMPGGRVWLHRVSVTVGISPAATNLPPDGTPVFGVRAVLDTTNPDREDELACLIALAARTALANWRPAGLLRTDGSSCARGAG